MRVLISGAGIAGPTLAWWLARYGFTPTLVEAAPALRTGGYVIDFWGAGFEVAARMGLEAAIHGEGYQVREVRVVGRDGRRIAGFDAAAFSRLAQRRFASLQRGDLAATIFAALEGRVETIFGDQIASIEAGPQKVSVGFERGGRRTFDLVVGADGVHSCVRRLVFGDDAQFEHYLGFKVAALAIDGYRPRDELAYVMFTEVGRQVARFAMRGDRSMFLFSFKDEDPALPCTSEEQKATLRRQFGASGWECPRILAALDSCSDLYFDRVSQIRMSSEQGLWTRGRVTLLGDAASCVSLLAGQGSALAMVAAYILAGELKRADGDYAAAFARYQQRFGPFVRNKQKAALRFADMFAPRSRFALFIRNQVMNLMTIPWVASLAMGRDLADAIELPHY
ncbi:MAG TPA: FAD-binding domain [Acidobacteriaceae bacterium]|jgi:2-polyprenyl-6-methoxyphenol hydroxylase-like FAD-dependent oxidoreductase|nr:FAD-binding domain [Acidobacteriaceae bacterium]